MQTPNKLKEIKTEIKQLKNPAKAKILQGFFKTGKGEYGEGDIFLGITVPLQRNLVKKYWQSLNLTDVDKLLKSKIHEERLIALLILVNKFQSACRRHPERSEGSQTLTDSSPSGLRMTPKKIFQFYLSHTKYINNWDLVDLSAPNIIGEYLINKNKQILYKLAKSNNLWERRIAILATFRFIKQKNSQHTLKLAKILLKDKHDLIHKAVGWMLREVGKRCSIKTLTNFLDQEVRQMPRTTLRYAIERLPKKLRKHYLFIKHDRRYNTKI